MMEIKRVKADEWGLVAGLFNDYRVFYHNPSDLGLATRFICERLNNNESVIFVAMDGDKSVGFTQLYPKFSSGRAQKNWILNDLFVDPDYRKQGLGGKLIETAAEYAKADGANFMQLETAFDNYTAQKLYNNMGFVKQQPDEQFYLYKLTLK